MIYFDNSATSGFKPECVVGAISSTLRLVSANPGRSGHTLAARAASIVYSARKSFATLVDCEPEGVVFCYNCTDALNMAIMGTATDGGHVITTAYEHNSVLRPLHELKRQGKISLTVLLPNDKGIVTADMIERAIKYNTYLIAVNHVSNVTGATSPIAEIGRIAKKHNIIFLVDGAQSVGYTHVDMKEQNIDMLAIAPHKGLHSAQGLGVLALGSGMIISPMRFGGTGTSSLSPFQPSEMPEALEAGTVATPAIAGANAGLKWTEKNFNHNQAKLHQLSLYFWELLNSNKDLIVYTPPSALNGIFSFNIRGVNSAEVSNYLNERFNICTRSGLHCAPLIHRYFGTESQGMVRASLSAQNTQKEIDILFAALKTMPKDYN